MGIVVVVHPFLCSFLITVTVHDLKGSSFGTVATHEAVQSTRALKDEHMETCLCLIGININKP